MRKSNIRNIAIISHVDHGKATWSMPCSGRPAPPGTSGRGGRVMDSMDLEKERGITIMAKNTAIWYRDVKINIVDTPVMPISAGEVERGLNMWTE